MSRASQPEGRTAYDEFLDLVRAGASVVQLVSHEWERVEGWCIGLADALHLPLFSWSSSSGLVELDGRGGRAGVNEDMVDPVEAMRELATRTEGGVLLLEDMHPYLRPEQHEVVRWVREMARLPEQPRRVFVLSSPLPELPPELVKEVPSVEIPLPSRRELGTVARDVAEHLQVPYQEDPALLDAARGLTVMEARLAFGRAALRRGRLGPGEVALVASEKRRVLRRGGVLEAYEPDAALDDVGGLENLKHWLDRRGRAFGPGAREFGLDAPKGVLLLGVQGCGKSLLAKAIASAWRFPLLRFDLGRVFGGIVGESESNMRMALQVAQALAPSVLWIDEIEKGLAGMGSSDRTDGGTTARVVGTLLTWMQEKTEPVFVVATANRIDLLPPELLRKGRFDEIFFVDLPTFRARQEIFSIHLRKKGREPGRFDLETLARASAGYSGAEIEEAVREALFEAFAEGEELATRHLLAALRATVPLSRTMAGEIEELRRWARVRARLATSEEPEPLEAQDVPRLPQERRRSLFVPAGEA